MYKTEVGRHGQSNGLSVSEESADDSTQEQSTPANRLTAIEARILGALMEKQLTTPDAYPLTVKSLLTACNQKSNREPVSNYEQGETIRTLRQLESRKFVRYEMGSRSERYEQRFTHELSISKKQQALLTVTMLRGPQTLSELQTRTQRMYDFQDRDDLLVSLERLTQGEQPLLMLIPRGAGQREDRYGHLLCGIPEAPVASATSSTSARSAGQELKALREQLARLEHAVDHLYALTGHSKPDDETELDQPDTH